MLPQQYQPGEWGFSDFTELKGLETRIQGEVFKHRLYHCRLAYNVWEHVVVIHGGESFVALAYELQNALKAFSAQGFGVLTAFGMYDSHRTAIVQSQSACKYITLLLPIIKVEMLAYLAVVG